MEVSNIDMDELKKKKKKAVKSEKKKLHQSRKETINA